MADDPDARAREFMLAEYKNIPALIAHWDTHFWQKSHWFSAVESVLLGAAAVSFKTTFLLGNAPPEPAFMFLTAACIFNFWICYVWFRTNRTNREYLTPLFERARALEAKFLGDWQGTFTVQRQYLDRAAHERHSSSRWESHLPSGFAMVWGAALLVAAWYGKHMVCGVGTLALACVALCLFERFHPKRKTQSNAKQ